MLKVKHLTKVYTSKKGVKVTALYDVSIDFGDSGLVFILGKSGSGKSTLLNLIGGLDSADNGVFIIDGRMSLDFTESDFDGYRNTYIGCIFQEYNLIDDYTAGANVALALELQGKSADKAVIDEALIKVGLTDGRGDTLYGRHTSELSGGQKQRVAIARALVKDPKIILADEPTGALDSETGEQLYELLKTLSKDKLIIVVSHDRDSAEKYGDRIIKIADGEVADDIILSDTAKEEQQEHVLCNFIKSRLPIRRSITMAAGALKTKKIRLAVSVVLSLFAFVLFGFTLAASITDPYTAELMSMYQKGHRMLGLRCVNEETVPVVYGQDIGFNRGIGFPNNLGTHGVHGMFEYEGSSFTIEIDASVTENDLIITPDARFKDKSLCRLPQNSDEIAITEHWADMFIEWGYAENRSANYDGPERKTIIIKTPDDLIGKKLLWEKSTTRTICGVYSTEIDYNEYRAKDRAGDLDYFSKAFMYGRSTSMVSSNIIFKNTNAPCYGVLHKLTGDLDTDLAAILRYGGDIWLMSAFSELVSWVRGYQLYVQPVVVGIAVMFTVFAMLLFANYLTISVIARKKELGILRALGARKRDVTVICLLESLIIAAAVFILSLIAIILTCTIVNGLLRASVLNFGFVPILLLFLLVFGVAALASILPVRYMARRKPVDIINNR